MLRHAGAARSFHWGLAAVVLAGFAVLVWLLHAPAQRVEPSPARGMPTAAAVVDRGLPLNERPPLASVPQAAAAMAVPEPAAAEDSALPPQWQPASATADDWPSSDLNDIARYISPADPEPTMAELIHALRETGEYGGIAAFNPPGTSPPLVGIAVPEDYELPPGYVRHYQATDDGQPIEAILMYAPDHRFYDAQGNEIEIPEDRVVPADRLPAGLLPRAVEIPAAE
jgi:hypothetical protein